MVLIYDSFVQVASSGIEGECLIGVSCNTWHYSGSLFFCDQADPFPSTVSCWTSSENTTPVCVQPGTGWKSALTGTIVAGVFAIILFSIAYTINRNYKNSPPTPPSEPEFEVVGVMNPQPVPVIRVENPVLVRPPSPVISARDVKVVQN